MRFPEFSGEWEKTTLGNIGETFNGLTGKSGADFGQGSPYITYKSIFDNSRIDLSRVELVTITDQERQKGTQNKVQYGDIFFTTSSETPEEVGMTSVLLDDIEDCYLNSFCFGYRLYSKEHILPEYMRFYLRTQGVRKKLFVLAQGSTRFNISKGEVMNVSVAIPEIKEQEKIAKFLSLLEERIDTQIKIIEDLKKLKSAISKILFSACGNSNNIKLLGEICSITTGRLDANAMSDDGIYPLFTCARENYKTNTYAFDGDSLLISGNGEIGIIKRYNGKFNAYQRTYVLQNFTENIEYLKYYIEYCLPKRVYKEKNVGAMPYIVLSTLADMPIDLPSINMQNFICSTLSCISNLIEINSQINDSYQLQKASLLAQMFI